MRNRTLAFAPILLLCAALLPAALTLTTSSNPVYVGQTFNFMAASDCAFSVPLITINFGDGTVMTQSGSVFSGSHAYASAGAYTIMATDPICGDSAALTMQVQQCPAMMFVTTTLPGATQGAAYSAPIQISGGVYPLRWFLSGGALPPGLALSSSTGLLSGTPSSPGTFAFTVTVQDNCPSPQQSSLGFTITVNAACPPVTIITASLPNGAVGAPYAAGVQISGGTASFAFRVSAGQLPPGILLDPSTGALSGIPSQEGTYGFTVTVQDSCVPPQTAARALQIVVSPPACAPLVVPPAAPPEAVIQAAYAYTFQVVSGVPPYLWSIQSGRLPSGLSLTPSGELAGVPGEIGQFPLTLRVTDGCRSPGPQQTTVSIVLVVVPPSLTITVMPPAFGVSKEASARVPLTYAFSERHGADLSLTSSGYEVLVGEAVVMSQAQPLSVSVVRGSGSVSETVVIPASLLQDARKSGAQGVAVRRSFTSGPSAWTARAEGHFSGTAGAVFGLRRVMIFFERGVGHRVVPLGTGNLTASATLWYTGTGLISGSWRVDDRVLSIFNTNVTFGDSVTLVSPPLPAFETGPHLVLLVIDRPEASFAIPEISYQVAAAEQSVRLLAPSPEEEVGGMVAFRWEAVGDLPLFSLAVARGEDEPPLFRSMTRERSYMLPLEVTRNWPPDTLLFWRVAAEDGAGKTLVESAWGSFHFMPVKKSDPQVVVLVKDEQLAECREWLKQNSLKTLGETALPSLSGTLLLIQAGSSKEAAKTEKLLARQPFVQLAAPNRLFNTMTEAAPYADYLYPIRDLRVDQVHRRWTGKGITVAVVDSGVAAGHPDLASRIREKDNFIGGEYSEEFHGTAVAGLIVGSGEGGKGYVGIAPGAQILALRACEEVGKENPFSVCQTWTLAKAVDYAIQHEADVLNLSLGGEEDPLLARLIQATLEKGIVVVAASGNGGPDGPSAFPGTIPGVISVGATSEDGSVLPSTSRGKVDVAAPGQDIFAPVPKDRYNFFNGTSMACAQVSGMAALMLEMKPGLLPAEVQKILRETALPLDDLKAQGAGLLQPCAITEKLTGEACQK